MLAKKKWKNIIGDFYVLIDDELDHELIQNKIEIIIDKELSLIIKGCNLPESWLKPNLKNISLSLRQLSTVLENVFIILLVLFNFWTIWFFMREEKERCLPKREKVKKQNHR